MRIIIYLVLFSTAFNLANAQESQAVTSIKYTSNNKGKISVSWGGNRDFFTKSDIHFTGNDYDFTLYDVKAHDKPKGWHIDYINPARMTIPQTNFNLSYYISNHYIISGGLDHMKYVMTQDQIAKIGGAIGDNYPDYAGNYTKDGNHTIDLSDEKFLKFEHTDGLNYIFVSISRVDDLSEILGLPNTDKFQINLIEGIGTGVLFPKTNVTLLGKERHDEFHVAGFGIDAKAGLNFTFFKHFFVQTDLKGGFINMPDIQTTVSNSDRASQHFFYGQTVISFGVIFKV